MKEHPLMLDRSNEFVCVSDINNDYIELNKVLYNPTLPTPIRKEYLQKITFESFRFIFTNEQLDYLCTFEHTQCDQFIDEFKRLKKEIKNEYE